MLILSYCIHVYIYTHTVGRGRPRAGRAPRRHERQAEGAEREDQSRVDLC